MQSNHNTSTSQTVKVKKDPKQLISIIAAVLLFVAACGWSIVKFVWKPDFLYPKRQNANVPAKEVQKPTTDFKSTDAVTEKPDLEQEQIESVKVTPNQNEGKNPNTSTDLTGSITTAFVRKNAPEVLVTLDQFLKDGQCSLSFRKGSKMVSGGISKISADASTSHCGNFQINADELELGSWQVEIQVKSGNKTGTIARELEVL